MSSASIYETVHLQIGHTLRPVTVLNRPMEQNVPLGESQIPLYPETLAFTPITPPMKIIYSNCFLEVMVQHLREQSLKLD